MRKVFATILAATLVVTVFLILITAFTVGLARWANTSETACTTVGGYPEYNHKKIDPTCAPSFELGPCPSRKVYIRCDFLRKKGICQRLLNDWSFDTAYFSFRSLLFGRFVSWGICPDLE